MRPGSFAVERPMASMNRIVTPRGSSKCNSISHGSGRTAFTQIPPRMNTRFDADH